jgi:hypothetical protein
MSKKITRILTDKQKKAFSVLLEAVREKGKQYVYTQGKHIEWFTIEEIEYEPYYEIKYKSDTYLKVALHTYENGCKQFVLKLHDELCKNKIISQETNDYFFSKELEVSTFVMNSLNEMLSIKNKDIDGYISIKDDGSELQNFKKHFVYDSEDEPEKIDVIKESEAIFNVLNTIIKGLSDGQNTFLKDLKYDKEEVFKSFNIYKTISVDENNKEVSLEQLMDEHNKNIDNITLGMTLSEENISDIEKYVLELTNRNMTELESRCIESLSKFLNLGVFAYATNKQKQQIYLLLSSRDSE